jgi:hypothetical protein
VGFPVPLIPQDKESCGSVHRTSHIARRKCDFSFSRILAPYTSINLAVMLPKSDKISCLIIGNWKNDIVKDYVLEVLYV